MGGTGAWEFNDFGIKAVAAETTDNYEGSGRQMVKLTVTYEVPPLDVFLLWSRDTGASTYERGIGYRYGVYIQAYSTVTNLAYHPTVTNMMAAQIGEGDAPFVYGSDQNAEADNGAYYPAEQVAFSDLNNDGDASALNTVFDSYTQSYKVSGAAGTGTKKEVRADDESSRYGQSAIVATDGAYTYRLGFTRNASTTSNLVIYDTLENAFGSSDHWQGMLCGIDTSSLDSLVANHDKCPAAKVYVNAAAIDEATYLTTGSYAGLVPADLTAANGWNLVDPAAYADWGSAKSIAVDLSTCNDGSDLVITPDGEVAGVSANLKMRAPSSAPTAQTAATRVYAYNGIYYYSENESAGNPVVKSTVKGNVVTVSMPTPVSAELSGTKVLKVDGQDASSTIAAGQFGFGDITFAKEGDYSFTVTETAGSDGAMSYDGSSYTASIAISKDADGNLAAGAWSYGLGGDQVAAITFTNTKITPPVVTPPVVTPPAVDEPTKESVVAGEGARAPQLAKTGDATHLAGVALGVVACASLVLLCFARARRRN